jgi:DNA-directed RNA polymerase subunit K/omega
VVKTTFYRHIIQAKRLKSEFIFSISIYSQMADDEDMNDFEEDLDIGVDEAIISDDVSKADPLAALLKHHPECLIVYAEDIASKIPLLASPPLDKDPNHKAPPFLTQYERTKVISMRANQLSQGARPYIAIPEYVTEVGEIARLELQERRLPFIIKRPMPDGSQEYWRLADLLIL